MSRSDRLLAHQGDRNPVASLVVRLSLSPSLPLELVADIDDVLTLLLAPRSNTRTRTVHTTHHFALPLWCIAALGRDSAPTNWRVLSQHDRPVRPNGPRFRAAMPPIYLNAAVPD
jgi:hypothetical protein